MAVIFLGPLSMLCAFYPTEVAARTPNNVSSLPSRYATTSRLLTSFQPPNIT